MKREIVKLDARRRTLTVDGRSVVLQEKSWQVLSMLVTRAPQVVTRTDIINKVWRGNYQTGEKGLNQAVWSIRAALGEKPREPKFIRTLPRTGYQWIRSDILIAGDDVQARRWDKPLMLAGVVALAAIVVTGTYTTTMSFIDDAAPSTERSDRVATKAYLVNRDVHVEFASGCLGIMKNANNVEVSRPVLSVDGKEVAVMLREPESCRLVTIDVVSGERQDFGNCPAT